LGCRSRVLAGSIVAHGGARVGVAGGDLDIPEVDAGVEHGGDEGVPEHVRVHAGQLDTGVLGEPAQSSGSAVPIHARAACGQKHRAGAPLVNGALEGAAHSEWKRNEYDLVALAAYPQHSVAVLLAEVLDVAAGGFEDPEPSRPSMVTGAKSQRFVDCLAVVSRASNWRWVNPSVGHSAGTFGRRTYSAGECSSTPSMTQVRYQPATTDIRRETVEGRWRRTSCSQRTKSSMCGRVAPSGSRSCCSHQVR
jgi:hypothetical protein